MRLVGLAGLDVHLTEGVLLACCQPMCCVQVGPVRHARRAFLKRELLAQVLAFVSTALEDIVMVRVPCSTRAVYRSTRRFRSQKGA